MIHKPEMLILDEPTSGVDPVARDAFWRMLVELSRRDQVTIFISAHFMNEAERCDRIALMHEGRVLSTCCLRFTSGVATTHARLASGWLADLCGVGVEPTGSR